LKGGGRSLPYGSYEVLMQSERYKFIQVYLGHGLKTTIEDHPELQYLCEFLLVEMGSPRFLARNIESIDACIRKEIPVFYEYRETMSMHCNQENCTFRFHDSELEPEVVSIEVVKEVFLVHQENLLERLKSSNHTVLNSENEPQP
jgi:hypothetical protein